MKGLFAIVAGPRLGGKTTLAGTCPGSTLLLQAGMLETGSRSAQALAKKRGNKLSVKTFDDLVALRAILDKVERGEVITLDNGQTLVTAEVASLYVDGLSAITDLRFDQADVQALVKKNVWDGYLKLGVDVLKLIVEMKELTTLPKNVFVTCALKKQDEKGGDVELETKGKMAVTAITKLGEAVLTVLELPNEQGIKKRVIIGKNYDVWPGRIDGILDEDNPTFFEPDLAKILSLIDGIDAA